MAINDETIREAQETDRANMPRRTYLAVPFEKKDALKDSAVRAGFTLSWDQKKMLWYARADVDTAVLAGWQAKNAVKEVITTDQGAVRQQGQQERNPKQVVANVIVERRAPPRTPIPRLATEKQHIRRLGQQIRDSNEIEKFVSVPGFTSVRRVDGETGLTTKEKLVLGTRYSLRSYRVNKDGEKQLYQKKDNNPFREKDVRNESDGSKHVDRRTHNGTLIRVYSVNPDGSRFFRHEKYGSYENKVTNVDNEAGTHEREIRFTKAYGRGYLIDDQGNETVINKRIMLSSTAVLRGDDGKISDRIKTKRLSGLINRTYNVADPSEVPSKGVDAEKGKTTGRRIGFYRMSVEQNEQGGETSTWKLGKSGRLFQRRKSLDPSGRPQTETTILGMTIYGKDKLLAKSPSERETGLTGTRRSVDSRVSEERSNSMEQPSVSADSPQPNARAQNGMKKADSEPRFTQLRDEFEPHRSPTPSVTGVRNGGTRAASPAAPGPSNARASSADTSRPSSVSGNDCPSADEWAALMEAEEAHQTPRSSMSTVDNRGPQGARNPNETAKSGKYSAPAGISSDAHNAAFDSRDDISVFSDFDFDNLDFGSLEGEPLEPSRVAHANHDSRDNKPSRGLDVRDDHVLAR